MVRVTRRADGTFRVGKGPGRGAWLCAARPECFEEARRCGAFARAFREGIGEGALETLGRGLSDRPGAVDR